MINEKGHRKAMQASKIPDYEPVLKMRNGTFQFVIRELYIKGTGDTVSGAYKDLLEKKEAIIKEFRNDDALANLPSPRGGHTFVSRQGFAPNVFTIKSAIVGLIVLAVMIVGLNSLQSTIESTRLISGMEVLKRIEQGIAALGAPGQAMSPEQQEEIIHNLRSLVVQVKPFVDELAPLFQCPSPGNAPGDSVCGEKAE
jgi:hypothetical protein